MGDLVGQLGQLVEPQLCRAGGPAPDLEAVTHQPLLDLGRWVPAKDQKPHTTIPPGDLAQLGGIGLREDRQARPIIVLERLSAPHRAEHDGVRGLFLLGDASGQRVQIFHGAMVVLPQEEHRDGHNERGSRE